MPRRSSWTRAEVDDRLVEIVHGHGDAAAEEVEHVAFDLAAVLAGPGDGQFSRSRHHEIGGAVLVAIGVTADDDGFIQPGTRRGTFLQMMGSRKMVPPRMLRIVPLGDFHICLS